MNSYIKNLKESLMADENKVEYIVNVAAGIIYRDGDNGERKVLLIQRAAEDHWPLHYEFPRGKCDKGKNEDVKNCAMREIKEETGLDVVIEKYLGKYAYYADGGKRKSICYNFLCRMKDPDQEPKLSNEHKRYKWITQVGEAELLLYPDQRKFVEYVLSKDNQIRNTPENDFTVNNKVEEYLKLLKC